MRKYISIFVLIALFLAGCVSSREEITTESTAYTEKADESINMTVFEKIFLPMAGGGSRPSMEDFAALLEREGIAWREDEGILDVSDPEHDGSYLYGVLTNERDIVEIAEMGYHFHATDGEYEVKVDMTGKEIKYFVDVTLLNSGTEVLSVEDVKTYIYDAIKKEKPDATNEIPFQFFYRGFTPIPMEDRDTYEKFSNAGMQIIQSWDELSAFTEQYCPGIPYHIDVDYTRECLLASVVGFAKPTYNSAQKLISLKVENGKLVFAYDEDPNHSIYALNGDVSNFYVEILVVNRADLESRGYTIAPPGELLYRTDFTLCAGKEGTVELYGRETDVRYGVSDVEVRLEDGTMISLSVQDGLAQYWGEEGISYTESWAADGGLVLEDVNFDGYTDIGLQVQTPAYNSPYMYWYYDPDSASYRVLGSFLSPLVVDATTQRGQAEYRDGQVYYREIYKAQGPLLESEERWITEYIDGQSVTRKDPQGK